MDQEEQVLRMPPRSGRQRGRLTTATATFPSRQEGKNEILVEKGA